MWKRNISIGATVSLLIISAVLGFTNYNQQQRIDALEQIRVSTSETVETEVQRYLANNGTGLMLNVLDESGTSTEELINGALNELITSNETGSTITMEFTDNQKAELAKMLSDITYENITTEVISGQKQLDVTKLENEVASAVTDVMMNYVDSVEKRYVTIEGDTQAIVSEVVSKLSAEILNTVSQAGQTGDKIVTENDVKNAVSKEEIEELVRKIVSSSSVTKESKAEFEQSVIQSTIDSLKKYNVVKAGKDGKDGADAVFSETEKDELVEDILTNLSKDEELSIYGVEGNGIVGTSFSGRDVYLLVGKESEGANSPTVQELSLGSIVGNSLLGMKTVNSGTGNSVNGSPDLSASYKLVYYTQFRVDDNSISTENTTDETNGVKYCRIHEDYASAGADHCDSYDNKEDCYLEYYYENTAGVLELKQETIQKVIKTMEESIVKSLEDQLGSDATLGKTFKNLTDLQTNIESLKETIIGNGSKDGINVLLNHNKNESDPKNASAGSLTKYVADVQDISSRFDTFKDIAGAESSNGQGYTETYDNLTMASQFVSINTGNGTDDGNGYYTVTVSGYKGLNSAPTISLIGSDNQAGTVPNIEQSKLWSLCKYIKVKKATDKTAADGEITFYFAYDAKNQTILNRNTDLYFVFSNIGLPSDQDTMVLTNQTTTDYGVVRVKDYDNTNNVLSLEGYSHTDDLVISDFIRIN